MADLSLRGTLSLRSAQVDWLSESARCVGVFCSDEHGALEVEYRVQLDPAILGLLAQAFLKAGLPILRSPVATPSKYSVPVDGEDVSVTDEPLMFRKKRPYRRRQVVENNNGHDVPAEVST